ncbi:MAG: PadR family transcriptional regulator [Gaiellaceae bacterium]
MSSELTSFSYAVLALVGEGGAGPHDLVESMRRGSRPYWAASTRHMYAEPKRLAQLGYLSSTKQPGKTRERTVYQLTDQGIDALRAWVPRPTPFPRIQNEAAVRLVAGYLVPDEQLLASLQALHAELDAVAAGLDDAERYAATLPHRERYLRLVHSLGRRLVAAHREWLSEVEHELG